MSKETLEVVRGIGQAFARIGYDGAIDEDGAPIEIGLKREQGHPVYSSRVMDGFNVNISGKTLILSYHSDIKLKDVYSQNLESEIEQMMSKIIKALKKSYKGVTGKALSLKEKCPCDARVESTSRVRVFVTAKKLYEIGNLGDVENVGEPSKLSLEKSFKTFLEKDAGSKRPKNDKRKKEKA